MANKIVVQLDLSHRLLYPMNTSLVTSKGLGGQVSIIAETWIMPVSVKPPLLVMRSRPELYSYSLIKESKEFVVNILPFESAQVTRFLWTTKYAGPRSNLFFSELGYTAGKAKQVETPIVEECVAHLECRLETVVMVGNYALMIGQVVAAYANQGIFNRVYDIAKHHPCMYMGSNCFSTTTEEMKETQSTSDIIYTLLQNHDENDK